MKLMIDETKCNKDGICVEVCPNKIIELTNGDGFPQVIQGLEALCIGCGHCVSVCPQGALNHPKVPSRACTPIKKDLFISEEQTFQLLRYRRSVRVYKNDSVDGETIEKLIEIASYAPTSGNSQMVRWIGVKDKRKIQELTDMTIDWMRYKLSETPYNFRYPAEFLNLVISQREKGEDPILRKAPALVIAMAPQIIATDPTLALSYFEIAATSMGLGTCWAGLFRAALLEWEPARNAMGLKDDPSIFYYPLMLGYPKYKYRLLPKRNPPSIKWI